MTRRHVLLVGLPGSGKTSAGEMAARALGAEFVDIDRAIEQDAGMTVAEIFASRGEAEFRSLERRWVERALAASPMVVAPGGGWAAQPGNWDAVAGRALTIYLETQPATAAGRAEPAGTRPLLAGGDAAARLRELLVTREPFYRRADAVVTTDRQTVSQVAQAVVVLARSRGGW